MEVAGRFEDTALSKNKDCR